MNLHASNNQSTTRIHQHTPTTEGLHCIPMDQQQLPHPTTISHIHNTRTQQPACFTTPRAFTAPSNQRACPHHTHILHNQRASHTLSIIKALHTRELHIHTHSNNQRVHTPTHTFPTTKPFTHTPPKEFYSPSQGASYTTPRAKCFTPTQNSQSSLYRHPHKRKPQVLRFVCHSGRYLNTKTFNCDFLFRLMSRERLEEGGGGWRERAITPESFLC